MVCHSKPLAGCLTQCQGEGFFYQTQGGYKIPNMVYHMTPMISLWAFCFATLDFQGNNQPKSFREVHHPPLL